MQDSADRVSDGPAANGRAPGDAEALTELRHLLIGPEIDSIAQLKSQLSNLRSQADDPENFARNVRKHPRQIADAISPVLGPAIRKSIADALSRMTQALTEALDNSLSIQGLKWRVEAMRSGKSFAEVVLLHTLVFRVEQVFLIHRDTGLLLQHAAAGSAQTQDADMVSSMLTAIQDFVRDSFGAKEGESLDNVRMGELTIWIEQGPHAILGAVIRGSAPGELREMMKDVLARIHLTCGEELSHFQGDSAPFEAIRPDLEECLQSAQSRQRRVGGISWQIAAAVLLLLIAVSGWISWVVIHHNRWSHFIATLSAEPGIVVTGQDSHRGKHYIIGLRDPLSADPGAIAISAGIDPSDVEFQWQPFIALYEPFVLERVRSLLAPPVTVNLSLNDNILHASGTARSEWVNNARRVAPLVSGISRFDATGVKIDDGPPDTTAIDRLRLHIDAQTIHFAPDSSAIDAHESAVLTSIASEMVELCNNAADVGMAVSIRLHGREVLIRNDRNADEISRQRAANVRDLLIARGVPGKILTASNEVVAPQSPQADLTRSRSVSFEVTLITESRKAESHK